MKKSLKIKENGGELHLKIKQQLELRTMEGYNANEAFVFTLNANMTL